MVPEDTLIITLTGIAADGSRPLRATTIVLGYMRAVKDGCLRAHTLNVVHCKDAADCAEARSCGWLSVGESQLPANYCSILTFVVIVTNRFPTNKDVALVRSRSSHQLYLWNTAIGTRLSVTAVIYAVVAFTNMVWSALAVTVTVALFVRAPIAD